MKEILLLRHGQASHDRSYPDFQRPLTLAGADSCRQLGKALLVDKRFPQSVLSSPAKRTLQSSQLVCEQLLIPETGIRYDEVLYLASAATYLDSLRRFSPKYHRILLVAHNPGLEEIISSLTGRQHIVNPADLYVLGFEGDWQEIQAGQCQLIKHYPAA